MLAELTDVLFSYVLSSETFSFVQDVDLIVALVLIVVVMVTVLMLLVLFVLVVVVRHYAVIFRDLGSMRGLRLLSGKFYWTKIH